jgi:hypothetical protein
MQIAISAIGIHLKQPTNLQLSLLANLLLSLILPAWVGIASIPQVQVTMLLLFMRSIQSLIESTMLGINQDISMKMIWLSSANITSQLMISWSSQRNVNFKSILRLFTTTFGSMKFHFGLMDNLLPIWLFTLVSNFSRDSLHVSCMVLQIMVWLIYYMLTW